MVSDADRGGHVDKLHRRRAEFQPWKCVCRERTACGEHRASPAVVILGFETDVVEDLGVREDEEAFEAFIADAFSGSIVPSMLAT